MHLFVVNFRITVQGSTREVARMSIIQHTEYEGLLEISLRSRRCSDSTVLVTYRRPDCSIDRRANTPSYISVEPKKAQRLKVCDRMLRYEVSID